LEDIRDAMRKVSDYVEGMDLADFMADLAKRIPEME
jgi:uncharacterized protein with HEPN domain